MKSIKHLFAGLKISTNLASVEETKVICRLFTIVESILILLGVVALIGNIFELIPQAVALNVLIIWVLTFSILRVLFVRRK